MATHQWASERTQARWALKPAAVPFDAHATTLRARAGVALLDEHADLIHEAVWAIIAIPTGIKAGNLRRR